MHGSVRGELENLLAAKPSAGASGIVNHMAACGDCASEFDSMRRHSQMLKTLQANSCAEPAAGFYSRVMQRIEASARRSIWWVFVYSPIGKRLAYASLALSLALGSYVVAAESRDGHLRSSDDASTRTVRSSSEHYDIVVTGTADEQRAAVLANFVSHPAVEPITLTQ